MTIRSTHHTKPIQRGLHSFGDETFLSLEKSKAQQIQDENLKEISWLDLHSLDETKRKLSLGCEIKPVLLVVEWIYRLIKEKIVSWVHAKENHSEALIIRILHQLKNQEHLTFSEYVTLVHHMKNPEEFKEETGKILFKFYQKGFFNRISYHCLQDLLRKEKLYDIWSYVQSISVINHLHHHMKEIKDVVSDEQALRWKLDLEEAFNDTSFNPTIAVKLDKLLAKIQLHQWLTKLHLDAKDIKELVETFKRDDEEAFKDKLKIHLMARAEAHKMQSFYYRSLVQFLDETHENIFTSLSACLVTEAYIQKQEKWLSLIKKSFVQESGKLSSHERKSIHLTLAKLHEAYAKLMKEEKCFLGRSLHALHAGEIHELWEEIEGKLNIGQGEHQFCSCLFSKKDLSKELASEERSRLLLIGSSVEVDSQDANKALRSYVDQKQFHLTSFEVENEILEHLGENVHQTQDASAYVLHQILRMGGYQKTLSCIKALEKVFKWDNSAHEKLTKDLIRERVLKERTDLLIVTDGRQAKAALEVASEMGISISLITADPEKVLSSFEKKITYPHFKIIVDPLVEIDATKLSEKVSLECIVRESFPLDISYEQSINKRDLEKLKKKHQVKPQDQVVLIQVENRSMLWIRGLIQAKIKGLHSDSHCLLLLDAQNMHRKKEIESYLARYPAIASSFTIIDTQDERVLSALIKMSDCLIVSPSSSMISKARMVGKKVIVEALDSKSVWFPHLKHQLEESELFVVDGHPSRMACLHQALLSRSSKGESKPTLSKNHQRLMSKLVQGSRHDPSCRTLQNCYRKPLKIPLIELHQQSFNMGVNQILLRKSLERVVQNRNVHITDEAMIALIFGKSVKLNSEDGIEPSEYYQDGQAIIVVQLFLRLFKQWEKNIHFRPTEDTRRLIYAAELFLQVLIKNGSKKEFIQEAMGQLDRMIVMAQLKNEGKSVQELLTLFEGSDVNVQLQIGSFAKRFKTAKVQRDFKKWCFEMTTHGRKKRMKEAQYEMKTSDYVLPPLHAAMSYLLHPSSIEFIRKLHLHRMVSGLNDHFIFDSKTGDVLIRHNHEMVRIHKLLDQFELVQGRILDNQHGHEYFYTHEKGLTMMSPDLWDPSKVPVFKTKERKTKDYRLEIYTRIASFDLQHAWFRLKTPDGKVYSVGKAWEEGLSRPYYQLFSTIPGSLRVGDIHEYSGDEKNFKVTKVPINKKAFESILKLTQRTQQELLDSEKGYNLMNSNCSSFVNEAAKLAGVKIPVKVMLVDALIPIPFIFRKFLYEHPQMLKLVNAVIYPLIVLRNILFYFLGGGSHYGQSKLKEEKIFSSFKKVFTSAHMIDHPKQVRFWQELKERDIALDMGSVKGQ